MTTGHGNNLTSVTVPSWGHQLYSFLGWAAAGQCQRLGPEYLRGLETRIDSRTRPHSGEQVGYTLGFPSKSARRASMVGYKAWVDETGLCCHVWVRYTTYRAYS